MRNLYKFLTLCFISCSVSLSAQTTITLDSTDGVDVTGLQVVIDTTLTANISVPYLYITNNSGTTQNWLITRKVISQPNDWSNYLCWGQLCYAASPLVLWSSNISTINDTEAGELTIYVSAGSAGSAHYRYYVSDGINYVDSVDLIVNITSTLGIDDFVQEELSLYPNPAQNTVTVDGLTSSKYSYSIFDMTGRQVLSNENFLNNEINVSKLSNGEYIFIIKNKETQSFENKKIIIEK